MKSIVALGGALALVASMGAPSYASTIIAPKSVTALSGGQAGGPGSNSPWWIGNTINQTGMNKTYVSGVTNFDQYIASAPLHNTGPFSEWNSAQGVFGAKLVFDFGEEVTLDALAWWDENSSSISNIYLSAGDGPRFKSFAVKDSPTTGDYGAQVFTFGAIKTRYLTIEMDGCGEGGPYNHRGCGLGEIAFRTGQVVAGVPEPTSWAIMILGFAGVGAALRRREGTAISAYALEV